MHEVFMLRALELALLGIGEVSPNPMVGAVIVKNGIIIAEGFHANYGGKHAEVNAIESCLESVEGATLYCNLEPCSTTYQGKINPPCCDLIIKSGISSLFIGQLDPNPKVSGCGVKKLRDSGIIVEVGLCGAESIELNRGFNSIMLSKRPYIHLKWAQTLDGQIATISGESKWISSEACRKDTHFLRSRCDAILVGRKTLFEDNPTLDARYGYSPSPRPIIIDSKLKSDPNLKVFKRDPLIITNTNIPKNRVERYSGDFIFLEGETFKIDTILQEVKSRGINSVFVEGGSNLLTQFLELGLWDRVTIYTSPKILGLGLSPIGKLPISHPRESITFSESEFNILDGHAVFNGYREGRSICLQV